MCSNEDYWEDLEEFINSLREAIKKRKRWDRLALKYETKKVPAGDYGFMAKTTYEHITRMARSEGCELSKVKFEDYDRYMVFLFDNTISQSEMSQLQGALYKR